MAFEPRVSDQLEMIEPKFVTAISRMDFSAYWERQVVEELVMKRSGALSVEYAPFDHIPHTAELALVGLTPGRSQALNALISLAADIKAGTALEIALMNAKNTVSFSGSMRTNLLAMLDLVKVPQAFGRRSAIEFFQQGNSLIHFTSALRYPVYMNGSNYSGSALEQPILRSMVESYLAEECKALPNAIWIPLGQHSEAALLYLASTGILNRDKVLAGLPHPSGANAERIAYFLGRKPREKLSVNTNPDKLDRLRSNLTEQVARVSGHIAK